MFALATHAPPSSGWRLAFAALNCAWMIPSRRGEVCSHPSKPETGIETARTHTSSKTSSRSECESILYRGDVSGVDLYQIW